MTDESLSKHGKNEFERYLNDKSVLELVSVMSYLDHEKSYAELLENGDVRNFIRKGEYKDIPINNINEFNDFYEVLLEKIADKGDEKKVKAYLEHASYKKELNELPKLMNKFERFNLDVIKPKLEAVFEYIYDAAMNQKFQMKRNCAEICKINSIISKREKVFIQINGTEFYLYKKINKKSGQENLGIQITYLGGKDQNPRNYLYPICDMNLTFEKIKESMLNNSKVVKDIKIILSLPQIMNKYLKNRISSLEGCLKELE